MNYYKQVKIQYDDGAFEICWIPEEFAHKHRRIIVDDKYARVLIIYMDIRLTEDLIEINQKFPLRKATDI
jgi:hypothetical protein